MSEADFDGSRLRGRRRLIDQLRDQGWSLAAIGRRLGISRQAVHAYLNRRRPAGTLCRGCGAVAVPAGRPTWVQGTGLCPRCLARKPGARFGQVLRAYRLAAGLSQAEVARRCRIRATSLCQYERDKHRPRPSTLARLARVLGPGLLAFPDGGGGCADPPADGRGLFCPQTAWQA
jgi:transcriptional regulator with XRE-family HTH domain